MPPRDESSTYALEDAVFFSQILARYYDYPLQDAFSAYEDLRRGLIDKAFDASRKLWQESRDMGLLPSQIKELITPISSPLGQKTVAPDTSYFVSTAGLPVPTHESFSDLSVYSLAQNLAGDK
jgi:2-polyprenyl-6-methoxyphenol hydroxylase-like FAD-dependent oxidoreductase